jgi:Gas vesicle synthesis protein GvpL/GvpF
VPVEEPPTATAEPLTKAAVYCYGVVWASSATDPSTLGVADAPVEIVRVQDLAALTSRIESTRVRARRRDLLRHSEVLIDALDKGTVLPLRFGTVFASVGELVSDFLEARHEELASLLREFEGYVELTVKAFYRESVILGEIVQQNPRVAQLREATRSGADAARYPLRVELGERIADELRSRTRRDAQELLGFLRPLARAVEIDGEPIEHQVLRASFLVDRKDVPAFDRTMDELARERSERMQFKYIGPLAPHSFVNLLPSEQR